MNKTVVMMDDDESICESVKKLVEAKGLAFVCADNLLEGTLEISINKPDIVIADFEFQFGRNIMTIIDLLKQKDKKGYYTNRLKTLLN